MEDDTNLPLNLTYKMSDLCDVKKNETKLNYFRFFPAFNVTYYLYNSTKIMRLNKCDNYLLYSLYTWAVVKWQEHILVSKASGKIIPKGLVQKHSTSS